MYEYTTRKDLFFLRGEFAEKISNNMSEDSED